MASESITPTSDQTSTFANGSYEVKRFPGEEGMKKVYLAIKIKGLDDTSRARSNVRPRLWAGWALKLT